jgi:hypothetical protein
MMTRRFFMSALLTAAAFAHMHSAAAQSSPSFPRLGGYLISGSVQSEFGTASYQQQVAKLGAAVVGIYPGWSSGGFNAQSAAAAVKAINPNIKLVPYTNLMELEPGVSASGSPYSPIYAAASSGNWFLRQAWPSGAVTDADGLSQIGLNETVPAYLQWRAKWTAANEFASGWSGVYLDNVLYQPRVNADYNQTGGAQTPAAAGQNWRNGYAAYVSDLRSALPAGSQIWGNVADWADGSISGYNQMLDGGVIESIIGQSYSYETQGWAQMMNAYKIIMNATKPGGYQIFSHDDSNTADYQGMRYGLASCLMDNGYYYFNVNSSSIPWFDEFNFVLGAPVAGPAGSATATYSNGGLVVYQNGVWRRDFQNGIVLVNPKGNGTQTVSLETSYKHLTGSQDPSINNGQTVTNVTLNERDGVILQRLTSVAVPDAPTLTVQ